MDCCLIFCSTGLLIAFCPVFLCSFMLLFHFALLYGAGHEPLSSRSTWDRKIGERIGMSFQRNRE